MLCYRSGPMCKLYANYVTFGLTTRVPGDRKVGARCARNVPHLTTLS